MEKTGRGVAEARKYKEKRQFWRKTQDINLLECLETMNKVGIPAIYCLRMPIYSKKRYIGGSKTPPKLHKRTFSQVNYGNEYSRYHFCTWIQYE